MRHAARVIFAAVLAVGGYLPAAVVATAPVAEAVGSAATGTWSTLGEYRVSPKPTSLTNRSREPIVTAHPSNPLRLAVVYAAGPGEESHPVVRISRDGGKTWRSTSGHPRGGGSHPMVAWGPGPTRGSARLWYTAMVGDPNNYHFGVSYSDNEGATWHLSYIADNTRGWFGGMEDITVDTNLASPNFGAIYLAYNWPKDPNGGDGLRVIASRNFGRTWSETEIPKVTPPTGYGDAWRIGYKLTTAPDGAAYVAGYQLDMKHWSITCPFCKGGTSNVGRIAFGVSRLHLDRATRQAHPFDERSRDEAAGDLVEPRLHVVAQGRERRVSPSRAGRRASWSMRRAGSTTPSRATAGSGSSTATTAAAHGTPATCPTPPARTAGRSCRCAPSSSWATGSWPSCSTPSMRRAAAGPPATRWR